MASDQIAISRAGAWYALSLIFSSLPVIASLSDAFRRPLKSILWQPAKNASTNAGNVCRNVMAVILDVR